jgi:hypothetical protein
MCDVTLIRHLGNAAIGGQLASARNTDGSVTFLKYAVSAVADADPNAMTMQTSFTVHFPRLPKLAHASPHIQRLPRPPQDLAPALFPPTPSLSALTSNPPSSPALHAYGASRRNFAGTKSAAGPCYTTAVCGGVIGYSMFVLF